MTPPNLSEHLFGGGSTALPANASQEEKFLHVVAHGVDWQAPEGQRSTRDFFGGLDLPGLVRREPNLLDRYADYTARLLTDACDSGQDFIGPFEHDDDLPGVLTQLLAIETATRDTQGTAVLSPDAFAALQEALDFAEGEIDNFEEFGEDAVEAAQTAMTQLQEFLARSTGTATPGRNVKP